MPLCDTHLHFAMNWKDLLYFSKTERNGIVVLIALIMLIAVSPMVYPRLFPVKVIDFSEFDQRIDQYEQLLADYYEARRSIEAQWERTQRAEATIQLQPFPFDPNLLSREEFMEMGLPERIAGNIINFRRSGGTFRFREDFNRFYSINDALYAQLEPYILLPSRAQREPRPHRQRDSAFVADRPQRTPVVIDINQADTLQWQELSGIGPVFSRRIVGYRDRLGGFYSREQLLEVFGMDTTRFEQILPQLVLGDNATLQKININTADFTTLVRHPYLDRNQVNSILRMREVHGPYASVEDIRRSDLIGDDLFRRIAPYLTVGE